MAADPPVKPGPPRPGPPLWLLLELTYRCPLHCAFCYNPTDFARSGAELGTDDWIRVLREARALGAVQLGLSGGEPLVARGSGGDRGRGAPAWLLYESDHLRGGFERNAPAGSQEMPGWITFSCRSRTAPRQMNDFLSSTRTFELKSAVAALIKQYDYPMVLNVVLHRLNIDHVEEILEMALRLGADYVELANTQYYGWAWHNREQLLPSRAQVERAEQTMQRFRERVGRRMQIFFVVPDYFETPSQALHERLGLDLSDHHAGRNRASLSRRAHVAGTRIPQRAQCRHRAHLVRVRGFNHFRGDAWMKEPCRSCPEKTRDFGGCRCQAYLLTGDAANADPVCDLSPHHHLVTEAVARAERSADAAPERPAGALRKSRWCSAARAIRLRCSPSVRGNDVATG